MKRYALCSMCIAALLIGCSDKSGQQAKSPESVDPKAIAESYTADEAKKAGDCEVFYTKQVSGAMGDPKTDGIAIVYATGNCKGGGNAVTNTVAVLEAKDGKGYLVSKVQLSSMEVSSVDSIAINSDGDVQLDVKSYGPDDPRCCPSVSKKMRFAFVNRNLVRLAEEATVHAKKSPANEQVVTPSGGSVGDQKTIKQQSIVSGDADKTPAGISKGSDDIALECTYSDSSSGTLTILIYSPKYSIAKIGRVASNGSWDPEYRIDQKLTNPASVDFYVTSYNWMVVKQVRPEAKMPSEKFTVNRTSLNARYTSSGGEMNSFLGIDYQCKLLSNELYVKFVKQILESSKKLEQGYKIK